MLASCGGLLLVGCSESGGATASDAVGADGTESSAVSNSVEASGEPSTEGRSTAGPSLVPRPSDSGVDAPSAPAPTMMGAGGSGGNHGGSSSPGANGGGGTGGDLAEAASGGAGSGGVGVGGSGGVPSSQGGAGGSEQGVMEIDPDAIFAASDGDPGGVGSVDAPTTLTVALGRVGAGQTIYLRGGTYVLDDTVTLSRSGAEGSLITLSAYPLDDGRPKLDFSSMSENSSNRGLILSGDHWHIYGIDVFKAGDNCLFVGGSHNVIEFSTFSECADTGLQLGNGAADNLVLNCDSFFNADSSLENADGFAAKLDVGTGNRFVGCRAWNNLDDGWDGYLRPANDVTTTYDSCWAIDNGRLKNGSVGAGDGNGFKTGGSDGKDLRHHAVYERCIATGNVNDGFDHNSNRGEVTILNSAAHDNGSNINFGTSNIAASLTIKNTISLGKNGALNATTTDITNNSWQDGRMATDGDFVSVDVSQLKAPRKRDGSLPDIDYLKLKPTSALRDVGVDVGLPFEGTAPDLGPFEGGE